MADTVGPGVCVVVAALLLAASGQTRVAADDQHTGHRASVPPAALLERPVPIRSGIGVAHDAVTTTSKDAQAFYDQGIAYLHDYIWIEAARSFHQTLRLDPKLAMAHAGLSVAYVELGLPAQAKDALGRAQRLGDRASAHDRRHIALRGLQMAAEDALGDATRLTAYRKALAEATAAFPADAELWLLRGVAEAQDPADRGQGATASSIPFFERALAASPDYFAAHHYLTHADENTNRIDEALKHGAAFAKLAPNVPHAQHMYAHNLRRVGRIDEAIAAFRAADDLENRYLTAEKIDPQLDWHCEHNLDLLALSYEYVGQMRNAEATFKRAFALPTSLAVQALNKREWIEFLIARGRIDDALAAARELSALPSPLTSAAGRIEAGRALLAAKQYQAAASESNRALSALRGATAGQLVAPALQELQGEFLLRTGQPERGRAALTQVIHQIRAAPGPDNWSQALFTLEAIARAAREVGDWEFAGIVAKEMVAHDPAYAGSHYAAGLVAQHAGDQAAMQKEFALARHYWSKADADLPELRSLK